LHDAQTQLVNLELICLHASCKCIELVKLKTLKIELGSQNVVFGKSGLGYKPRKKNNVKKLSSFSIPAKTKYVSFNSSKHVHSISCFYCMKSGRTYTTCRLKNYLVPKGLTKWLPKER